MRLEEPRWWYAAPHHIAGRLLAPAAWAWDHLARRRMARVTPYRCALPVICIGNFTAGGTGKTPLTIHVAGRLTAMGRRPAILTRGWGGQVIGARWVDPAAADAGRFGDEPLLLVTAAPVLVSRDRAAGARVIAADPRDFDCIIMDDGLQNPALFKDLVLAVVDGARGVGNGRVMPAGPLRMSLAAQLRITDAILVNHPPGELAHDPPNALMPGHAPILAQLRRDFAGAVLEVRTRPVGQTAWLVDRPVVAFCGIGNPARFFAMLNGLGARVVEAVAFPDHHAFTAGDATRLNRLVTQHGALLVTTEKDLARLSGATGALAELRASSCAIGIAVAPVDGDRPRLDALIGTAVRRQGHTTFSDIN